MKSTRLSVLFACLAGWLCTRNFELVVTLFSLGCVSIALTRIVFASIRCAGDSIPEMKGDLSFSRSLISEEIIPNMALWGVFFPFSATFIVFKYFQI